MKKTSSPATPSRAPSPAPRKDGLAAQLAKATSARLGNAPELDPDRDPNWARNHEIYQNEHIRLACGGGAQGTLAGKPKLRGRAMDAKAYELMRTQIKPAAARSVIGTSKKSFAGIDGVSKAEPYRRSGARAPQSQPTTPAAKSDPLAGIKLSRRDRESVEHFTHWKGLMGSARGDYYGKHSDAIWTGRRILQSHGILDQI